MLKHRAHKNVYFSLTLTNFLSTLILRVIAFIVGRSEGLYASHGNRDSTVTSRDVRETTVTVCRKLVLKILA